jgi:hypothetical protein
MTPLRTSMAIFLATAIGCGKLPSPEVRAEPGAADRTSACCAEPVFVVTSMLDQQNHVYFLDPTGQPLLAQVRTGDGAKQLAFGDGTFAIPNSFSATLDFFKQDLTPIQNDVAV